MGDAKKLRKTYSGPGHPWSKSRIDEESVLMKEYGLRNKKEIWKMASMLNNFKDQVKKLSALMTNQAEVEKQNLLTKLKKIKILSETSTLGDVLGLETKDVLERRLQTLVYRNGLANSISQARQFIVHRHICIGDKKIAVPSYIVSAEEEKNIVFSKTSDLANPDHPERAVEKKEEKEPKEKPHARFNQRGPGQRGAGQRQSGPRQAKPARHDKKESKPKEDKKEAKEEAKKGSSKEK